MLDIMPRTTSSSAIGTSAALTVLVLLCACPPPEAPSDEEPTTCPEGQLIDEGACVPEACGQGPWGDLARNEGTLHVDADSDEDGDGSEHAPYPSIAEALARAGDDGGGHVVVAQGEYRELLEWRPRGDLVLQGRCADLVIIDAQDADANAAALRLDAKDHSASASGLTIRGGEGLGVEVEGGEVNLHDLDIEGTGAPAISVWDAWATPPVATATNVTIRDVGVSGVLVQGEGTMLSIDGVEIHATRMSSGDTHGVGINVHSGGRVEASDCLIADSAAVGVRVKDTGSSAMLTGTRILDTQPEDIGAEGWGILAYEGADVEVSTSSIEGTRGEGVYGWAEGTRLRLVDTAIRGTIPSDAGQYGLGIVVTDGALLEGLDLEIAENHWVGVLSSGEGSEVTLQRTAVRDSMPIEVEGSAAYGMGVVTDSGAMLECADCTIQGNTFIGAMATGMGSELFLTSGQVLETAPGVLDFAGYGVHVQDGAALVLEDSVVEASHDVGISVSGPTTADGAMTTAVIERSEIRDTACVPWLGTLAGGYGITVNHTAYVELLDSVVADNRVMGVQVGWDGATLRVVDSLIEGTLMGTGLEGTAAPGIAVQRGATLEARGLTVRENEGPGLYVNDDSVARCDDCTLTGNDFAGAAVVHNARLELSASWIDDTQPSADLGGGVGIYVDPHDNGGEPSILVSDTEVGGALIAGIWLGGPGSFEILNSEVHGGEGEPHGSTVRCGDAVWAGRGIEAWDGSSGLLISGSSLGQAAGAAVFLDDASASLQGNSYTDVDVDLLVQGPSCHEPDESWTDAEDREICPSWDRPSCDLDFRTMLRVADPEE